MAGGEITFKNVCKRYGAVEALADFSLEIGAGEFMTFLGPSGSGKSTALNALAGFSDVTEGDILVDGRSMLELPPEKRNVGMVFQGYSLFPHMSVAENVAFPLKLRRYSRSEIANRVEQALSMVQLTDLAARMPNELSGGQRQRVAFARAVVFEPPVLLMDEPLGALDLKLRQSMQVEIKKYHAQLGCTIVFVTHDQGEALALSDRIAVLNNGRIAQVDTASRIYDFPKTRYVAEFIGRTNILTLLRDTGGEVRIAVPRAVQQGGEVGIVSLRPEKLVRLETERPDMISSPATVDDVLFLGDLVHYTATLSGGVTVKFQEHRGPGADVLRPAQPVRLGFLAEDALPIRDS